MITGLHIYSLSPAYHRAKGFFRPPGPEDAPVCNRLLPHRHLNGCTGTCREKYHRGTGTRHRNHKRRVKTKNKEINALPHLVDLTNVLPEPVKLWVHDAREQRPYASGNSGYVEIMVNAEETNRNNIFLMDQTANPAPLGLCAFGTTTILLSLWNAGVIGITSPIFAMAIFYGGLAQIIPGLMEWKKNNNFGFLTFVSFGFFWMTFPASSCSGSRPCQGTGAS